MSTIQIFTDGSSRGNPGPGGWGSIIATEESVKEIGGRESHTTNNRMELSAVIEALRTVRGGATRITVFSDSTYVIKGITQWVRSWLKNDWVNSQKKPVENRDLWERLLEVSQGKTIAWEYVAGHTGHFANERCDEIATSFADGTPVTLYEGPRSSYGVSLDHTASSSANRKEWYVSVVDGVVRRHGAWSECEMCVKGVPAAKFKKVKNDREESEVLARWGISR